MRISHRGLATSLLPKSGLGSSKRHTGDEKNMSVLVSTQPRYGDEPRPRVHVHGRTIGGNGSALNKLVSTRYPLGALPTKLASSLQRMSTKALVEDISCSEQGSECASEGGPLEVLA